MFALAQRKQLFYSNNMSYNIRPRNVFFLVLKNHFDSKRTRMSALPIFLVLITRIALINLHLIPFHEEIKR